MSIGLIALLCACASEPPGRRGEVGVFDAGSSGSSGHGGAGDPGSNGTAGTIDATDNALKVDVEDLAGMKIEIVTLACAGDCADIVAVARGGNEPYTFEWEDGSTDPERRVCLRESGELEVSATDTPIDTEEFQYEAATASTTVTATVLDCNDAGVLPAPDAGDCDEEVVVGDLMPDIFSNDPSFFAAGEELPAGQYRLSYVDGCLRYDPVIYNWAVNGAPTFEYFVIRNTTDELISRAPVSESLFGAPTFDECVALSVAEDMPLYFDFEGGKVGMFNNDFKPDDNTAGTAGRNPTFRLTRLVCGDANTF